MSIAAGVLVVVAASWTRPPEAPSNVTLDKYLMYCGEVIDDVPQARVLVNEQNASIGAPAEFTWTNSPLWEPNGVYECDVRTVTLENPTEESDEGNVFRFQVPLLRADPITDLVIEVRIEADSSP